MSHTSLRVRCGAIATSHRMAPLTRDIYYKTENTQSGSTQSLAKLSPSGLAVGKKRIVARSKREKKKHPAKFPLSTPFGVAGDRRRVPYDRRAAAEMAPATGVRGLQLTSGRLASARGVARTLLRPGNALGHSGRGT
ncbi:hypothetical protein MTO96_001373 [Rhipicephalus appendiculatus]